MDKVLLRTRAVINDCEKHLESTGAFGSEIEFYLAQHILVILCADVQQEIYQIAESRAVIAGDNELVNYVISSGRRILRSVQKDEIASFIGLFGSQAKDKLNSLVNERDVTLYNNAVRSRHDVAHKLGAQITIGDLKNTATAATRLLEAVRESLEKVVLENNVSK